MRYTGKYPRNHGRALTILTTCIILLFATTRGVTPAQKSQVSVERIDTLIKVANEQRHVTTLDGRSAWVPRPPSEDTIRELRSYGKDALPYLGRYLQSSDNQIRELVLEILQRLGGDAVVPLLGSVARNDPEPVLRKEALDYLRSFPWTEAEPVLKESAAADPDASVRAEAEYELRSHEAGARQEWSADFLKGRVQTIVDHVVARGDGILQNGAAVWTPSLCYASESEVEELKKYGDHGTAALAAYYGQADGRAKLVLIRILGRIGSGAAIGVLENIISSEAVPGLREQAVDWLPDAPWSVVSTILQTAADSDPDQSVRDAARRRLESLHPK